MAGSHNPPLLCHNALPPPDLREGAMHWLNCAGFCRLVVLREWSLMRRRATTCRAGGPL